MTLPTFEKVPGLTNKAQRSIAPLKLVLQTRLASFPILSPELESHFKLSGSEIRAIVSHLRCLDEPIGSSGKGYFWATTPAELNTSIQHLEGRANRLFKASAGLRNARSNMATNKQGEMFETLEDKS